MLGALRDSGYSTGYRKMKVRTVKRGRVTVDLCGEDEEDEQYE